MVVGGSGLVAAIAIFMSGKPGILAAMVAGIIMMGYITVEVLILKQVPPDPTGIEIFTFTPYQITLIWSYNENYRRAYNRYDVRRCSKYGLVVIFSYRVI